jgi:hypothetical protein
VKLLFLLINYRSIVTKIHLLKHLVQNVLRYGPLKFFTCFIFESLNHVFDEKVHGNYKYEESSTKYLILSQNMEFLIRKTKGAAFKFLSQKGQLKNLHKLEEHLFSVGKGKNFKFTKRNCRGWNKVLFKDFVQKPIVPHC